MMWSELGNLDENSALWRIPAERMKMRLAHLVPLSRQALAVLRELRASSLAAVPNIFPSPGKGGCMSSNAMLYALYRMGYGGRYPWLPSGSLHYSEVRRAYNAAEWMADRRRMMQWWADQVTALALEGDKIIPLSRVSYITE